jgi:two-component system, NtrC family, sensor kinase
VRSGAELARKYAGQTRLKLELELAGDLPHVLLDPTEIEQVVVNLITNAVQAADGAAHVQVRTSARDGGVELCVRDHGPGMAPEVLSHVFDPFFSTRRSQGGTGLGLSICHGIATDHGGTISAESEPGRGATFRLWLPAAPTTST